MVFKELLLMAEVEKWVGCVGSVTIQRNGYLDQLGMAAKYHTKVYCRPTLIGGNYGLLNKTTFMPNPDYYSALLWNRLMGTGVLAVDRRNIAPHLRTYGHCSKGKICITLLLINLSNQTHFRLNVRNILNIRNLHTTQHVTSKKKTSFIHGLKTTVSWVGTKSTYEKLSREEYHLTPLHGDIRRKPIVLNGIPLKLNVNGNIPILRPALVKVNYSVSIAPLSIKFLQFPNFDASGCKWWMFVDLLLM
ncbi:Glycoside hydrolase, family 79 [Artemisia annua]|uniref:Glycoside hydrolase, family 79 n=1 Tax=Artemisia annua TaxID=35608 RepID=A0A2U1MYC3_ARTAN|nr:Glycoside hydrolase, family 79 [Artemisia annua]